MKAHVPERIAPTHYCRRRSIADDMMGPRPSPTDVRPLLSLRKNPAKRSTATVDGATTPIRGRAKNLGTEPP